jgi:hypothetical protein
VENGAYVTFLAYGRKGMIDALRTESVRWGKFYICSMKLCIYGQRHIYLPS